MGKRDMKIWIPHFDDNNADNECYVDDSDDDRNDGDDGGGDDNEGNDYDDDDKYPC